MSFSPRHSISTTQAAERLGISREHVRRLILCGELRAEETVKGFMLDANEVGQYAWQRRILQDQRQFRAAIDDLASKARHISEAADINSAVAQVRDQIKSRPASDMAMAVASQVKWIEEQVMAREPLAALVESTMIVAEQWRRMEEDTRSAADYLASLGTLSGTIAVRGTPGHQRAQRGNDRVGQVTPAISGVKPPMGEGLRPAGLARGFVVSEPREPRLEQKVDALSRKVDQLTQLVAQRHTDIESEMPTWQRWAGSERPEDVLAKLDAIRRATTGGTQAGEDSTDVIRQSREARGGDA